MFPNLDTCTRHKIHTLQALVAFSIGHREYTKASWVLQSLVGYHTDWLGVPSAGGMFLNLDTCTRHKIQALQALVAYTAAHREYTKASWVFQ